MSARVAQSPAVAWMERAVITAKNRWAQRGPIRCCILGVQQPFHPVKLGGKLRCASAIGSEYHGNRQVSGTLHAIAIARYPGLTMILGLSTWPEIGGWLAKNKTVVIPIGSNEQHGPTGLLGTDWLCPEIIALEAHKGGGDILVAPTFNIGMAQHHLGFAGTISLRPSTFQAAIGDWVGSLSRHGFQKIFFLNGHGGNIASIEAAFSEIYAAYSFDAKPCPFMLKLRSWWHLTGITRLAEELFPTGHGSHATPSEIAITQSAYPESVKTASLSPKIAPLGPIRDAYDYRARFPDGRIGSDPLLATPEKGRRLITAAAAALLEDLAQFSAESFPISG